MNHSNIDFFLRAFQKFSEQLYFLATASVEQKTVTTIFFPYNLRSSHPQVFLETVVLKNSRELPDQGIFRAAILTFLGVLKSPKELGFFSRILQCFHSITSESLTFKRLRFFYPLIKLVILTFVIKSNVKTSVMLEHVTTYIHATTHIHIKPIFTQALMIWLTLSEARVFSMSVFPITRTI